MSNPQGAPFLGVSFVSFAALGSSSKVFKTSYTLNGIGQLTGALVRDGLPKDVAYTLDGLGQIVRRKEVRTTGNNTGLGPNELFYRFAGKQMGMVGNNGTVDVGYVQSVADRSRGTPDPTAWTAGIFRNGTNTGSSFYADFSQSLDPYNAGQQGSAGGGIYTVRTGDTLQAIAASLYGDGNLWYRIAEANGLSAGAALSEGQSLILPAGVTKSTHNASTFQPYDASEALGDTLPTTPKPPKTPKCGAFGQILSTLVAIAASQFLGPLFGNLVSQGFNMVIGIQSKFSWKSLGMSVVAAVVTGGMSGAFEGIKSAFLQGALQQATTSALTQGIGVATGLQKKFDFAGVAAAGVAGGVMSWVGARLGGRTPSVNAQDKTVWRNGDLSKTGAFLANSAGAIAEAATLSAIKGNSFGDNLLASLPSVIGRAALDGAGAKSILGDGWLGTALADPGSVLGLERGWITKAANSAISTVGNVVADMVRGNAQGSGGGAINIFGSSMVMDKFVPKGVRSDPLGPDALQNSSHAKKLVKVYYDSGTYSWEEREAPPTARKSVSRSNGPAKQSGVPVKRANGESAASDTEFIARMDSVIARLDMQDDDELIEVDVYSDKLAGAYDDIDTSLLGAINFDPIGPSLIDLKLSGAPYSSGPSASSSTYSPSTTAGFWSTVNQDRASAYADGRTSFYREVANISSPNYMSRVTVAAVDWFTKPARGAISGGLRATVFPDEKPDIYAYKLREWNNANNGIANYSFSNAQRRTFASEVIFAAATGRFMPGTGAVAAESEFIGPLIGKSGFRTSSEFADVVGTRYQGFVDDAFVAGQRLESRGLLRGNANTRLGNYVDRISQRDLSAYLRSEGISEGPGSLVQLNRYLRDPAGSGLYVRPDVRIPAAGRIFDATVGFKSYNSTQITRFGQYSGGNYITVTRPGPVGGSYSIVP